MGDVDFRLDLAKELACKDGAKVARRGLPSDYYVVWFCKVLGNWKALVSTDLVDNYYWEVTFNGATGEAYVDRYVKEENTAVQL